MRGERLKTIPLSVTIFKSEKFRGPFLRIKARFGERKVKNPTTEIRSEVNRTENSENLRRIERSFKNFSFS